MSTYTPWTWSPAHGKHYSYRLTAGGEILETFWSGPSGNPTANTRGQASIALSSKRSPHSGVERNSQGRETEAEAEDEDEDEEDYDDDDEEEEVDNIDQSYDVTGKGKGKGTDSSPINRFAPQNVVARQYAQNLTSPFASLSTQTYTYSSPHTIPHAAAKSSASVAKQGPKSFQQLASLQSYSYDYFPMPRTNRSTVASLPPDVQQTIGYKDRRYIQTGVDPNIGETLDNRFRRVVKHHHNAFFVLGRVFKMLWTEPAGLSNPGRTRNSTHFSTVWLNEQAFSEIRYFVVVRNKGSFSQCIPVQTYGGKGAKKPGLIMHEHGIIHTTLQAPTPLPGEHLSKYSIRVAPNENESLDPLSRVNYGKAYAVEHNVKVLDIGMVVENHQYMVINYFDAAMRGQ